MSDVFKLNINCGNDAFDNGNREHEIVRILREVANQIEDGAVDIEYFQTIRDINGNDVGRFALKPSDYWKD